MPEQLKDGTFAEEDYRTAFALDEAITLVREAFEGKVLVPNELLTRLEQWYLNNDLSYSAAIEDILELAPTQQGEG